MALLTPLTPLPPAANTSNPADFASVNDTFNAGLPPMVTELNDMAEALNAGVSIAEIVGTVTANGNVVMEEDSAANGRYTKLKGGLIICRHRIALPYISSSVCGATWTYPVAGLSGVAIGGSFDADTDAYDPDTEDLTGIYTDVVGTNSTPLSVQATTSFGTNDTGSWDVHLIANWN